MICVASIGENGYPVVADQIAIDTGIFVWTFLGAAAIAIIWCIVSLIRSR